MKTKTGKCNLKSVPGRIFPDLIPNKHKAPIAFGRQIKLIAMKCRNLPGKDLGVFAKLETLQSPSGAALAWRHQPAAAPEKGVLIVSHGLAEHSARYARFAPPACTAVQVSALFFPDALLEIQATAMLD